MDSGLKRAGALRFSKARIGRECMYSVHLGRGPAPLPLKCQSSGRLGPWPLPLYLLQMSRVCL